MAIGNQTQRVIGGNTYYLSYDAETRLVIIAGPALEVFYYNGDGNRVKSAIDSEVTSILTTTYIGNHFEWAGSTSSMNVRARYYYSGSIRVAMRTGSSTINYLLGDHLGSNAITTNSSGVKNSEIRYMPWGTTRYTNGTSPTTYQFTGQRLEISLGLLFYNARYYDPLVGRFAQLDTVVPRVGDTQSFDRYAYTNNNPIKYIDPTGHRTCEEDGYNCSGDEIPATPLSVSASTTPGPAATSKDNGPITNFIQSIPGSATFWNNVSKGADSLALTGDTFAAGVVTFGGIAGAGIAAPFIAGGAPVVPVTTGMGGIAISELYVQPLLRLDNVLATISMVSTIVADTKSSSTNIDDYKFSANTLNSITLTTAGWLIPEAYSSTVMQGIAVTNDVGVTSLPWSKSLPLGK